MGNDSAEGGIDEIVLAAAVLQAVAKVLADVDGSIDTASTLQHLACVAGWLISGYPAEAQQEVLDRHAGQIETWLDSRGDTSGFAEFIRASLH